MEKLDIVNIHYYLNNGTHQMDAFIHNECEKKMLSIMSVICKNLGVSPKVQVEAKQEGGLQDYYNLAISFFSDATPEYHIFVIGLVSQLLKLILSRKVKGKKVQDIASSTDNNFITNYLKSTDIDDYTKNKVEPMALAVKEIVSDTQIIKFSSDYYKNISNYDNVRKLDVNLKSSNNFSVCETISIEDFKEHIIDNTDLDPIELKDVEVEIVSPILNGQSKSWKGKYNDNGESRIITFSIEDQTFIENVTNGKISFKNGMTIICDMYIERKLNIDGTIKNSKYIIYNIHSSTDVA